MHMSVHLFTSNLFRFLMFSCCACSGPFSFLYIISGHLIMSFHLFTLFSHVLLLCVLGPRKRSSGPESGPETRVRAPKGPQRSVQDIVQVPKDKFGIVRICFIYIHTYIYIYIFIYIYIDLHISIYMYTHISIYI